MSTATDLDYTTFAGRLQANLYKSYDAYDSCVVAAVDEASAKYVNTRYAY
jgi:hypothetical protein